MTFLYRIEKLMDAINKVALYTAAALIALLLYGVLYAAIARIVMDQPPLWPDPITAYALMLATLFAAPQVMRDGQHIVVDALIKSVSVKVRRVLLLVGLFITTVTCAVMAVYAAQVTAIAIENGYLDARAISVPFAVLTAPITFCFGMMSLQAVRSFLLVYFRLEINNK
ncbi:TRAP transporter small permease [Pseudomonas benzenivorans]|uniref:TRAP transporter small permease protein n=1 Tax=Pseudomonas benzenivorans TaxID=556533 RepID=A0ABY5H971_9PSED|nr:TRAP transporter small permease subunit [Pseudomonas benzenivorans]UTW08881.1 TRAP transporter small permease subunit [Pseudomonas benzenivorans]